METNTHAREWLTTWLQDAYAMEKKAIQILERQAERLMDYPTLRQRVDEHRVTSEQQAEMVKRCLEKLGSDTSTVKDLSGQFMGNMAALGNAMAQDEVVKNALADYAFEHFEIACYRSLIAAANAAGELDIAATCEEILRQEEAMASWLENQLPMVTREFLQMEGTTA